MVNRIEHVVMLVYEDFTLLDEANVFDGAGEAGKAGRWFLDMGCVYGTGISGIWYLHKA